MNLRSIVYWPWSLIKYTRYTGSNVPLFYSNISRSKMGVRLRTNISKPISSQTKIRHGRTGDQMQKILPQMDSHPSEVYEHTMYNIVLICGQCMYMVSVHCPCVSVQCPCTSVSCTRMSVHVHARPCRVRAVSVQCPCNVRAVSMHVHTFYMLIYV